MKPETVLLSALLLIASGCGNDTTDDKSLGQQVGGAISDTRAMEEAQAAANQILRNAMDCEAVKANIEDVTRKLDEAEARIQTETGRTTMKALRLQVTRIAETCGAR